MRTISSCLTGWIGAGRFVAGTALAVLAGCQGTHNLAKRNCLPLQVPSSVVLVQEAGLYSVTDKSETFLIVHPRNSTNDTVSSVALIKTLPPGTQLRIEGLTQGWGFDSGLGRISAQGETLTGERFEYGWGVATAIGRAPWEPVSTPHSRTVECDD